MTFVFLCLTYFTYYDICRSIQRIILNLTSLVKCMMLRGNSRVVQWLGLRTLTAQGPASILDQETKTLQATWCGLKKKKKKSMTLIDNFGKKIILVA